MKFSLISALALVACSGIAAEKGDRELEIMIPMRDGVELHTVIFFPRKMEPGKKYPAIIDRSPYGYHDMEWIPDIFLPFGFVAIGQDMRGMFDYYILIVQLNQE